jgi:hypothetical protein
MTAANLFIAGAEAYLLTDTATLREPDWAVSEFRSKVVAGESLRMAITRNGVQWPGDNALVAAWLDEQPDEEAAIEALPELSRRLRSAFEAIGYQSELPMTFNLFVAVWSPERLRPEGYIVASHADGFAPGVQPDYAYLSGHYICPKVDRRFYPPQTGDWDPLDLLEAQRARLNPRGRYTVGGTAHLTIVSEAGVSKTVLREWPDEIGRRIEPECPSLPSRMTSPGASAAAR